jgi:hypothetical protein
MQTQGNYPEESIQHSEQGKSLKSRSKNSLCCKTMVGTVAKVMNYPETEEKFCKDLSGKHQLEDVLSPEVWFSNHPVLTTPPPNKGGGEREVFSSMAL